MLTFDLGGFLLFLPFAILSLHSSSDYLEIMYTNLVYCCVYVCVCKIHTYIYFRNIFLKFFHLNLNFLNYESI